MFSSIKLNEDEKVYIQIKNYIKDMILRGMLQKDEKLPSTRELSNIIDVSRNTVVNAYEYLKEEGFIYTVRGKGAFVAYSKITSQEIWNIDWENRLTDYAKKAENMDIVKHEKVWTKGMISFKSIAPDNNLFDIEDFKRAFLNIISLEGDKILNYGYAKGYKYLIEYLMEYMKNKGVDVKNKDILITNGFTEGFEIVLSSLTKEGDNVICENPTHNTAIKIMRLHNLNIIGVNANNNGIQLEDFENKLKKSKAKLIYIIPSYHNPTGMVMSPEKRVKIYEISKKYEIPIVEDGFNEELRYSGAHVSPIAALSGEGNSVIYVGSFSKVLFPGIRIGWVLADKNLISYMESIKRSKNIHTSFLDQAVLYQYLKEGNFDKYMKKARKVYKDKYEFALKCANKYIPCKKVYGEGGLHIFIKLDNLNARTLLDSCCKKNVIFTPGDIFYIDKNGWDTFRLGFSRVEKEDIEKGFKIIGDEIKKLNSIKVVE
ncbi:2-aminoadipate transaminase [Clostridium acetireducens DSM 10703]|uniref:2-aminoadipate transaminase n=1 Tax=Clostridium acetireducens DSM 10703 TaxID=1121290 RepID=A0A1E8EW79_9CLOT|nr:PLP-dependent aminotransferase family protein [Clostridium acetireducens]OFI01512.1 2-aminoadipate transaminase [Clostridium acetireducens DSM 10703]